MKKAFLCLLTLLLLCSPAFALDVVEPGSDFYYLDTANVLSEETEGIIYFSNQLLEEKCGAQIVVAALDSIGNADIYDYAVEMGNSWGIGSAEENNGFLLLMAIEEENYYAVTGRGLDGIFPASEIKKLYDKYLEKDFAAGDYDEGARKFFEAVFDKVSDYYNADVSVNDGEKAYEAYISSAKNSANFGGASGSRVIHQSDSRSSDKGPGFFSKLITFIVILYLLKAFFGRRRRGNDGCLSWLLPFMIFNNNNRHTHHRHHHTYHRPVNHHRGPRSGGFGGGGSFRGGSGGGGRSGGGGGFGGGAGRGRH